MNGQINEEKCIWKIGIKKMKKQNVYKIKMRNNRKI